MVEPAPMFMIGADRWPGLSKLVEECGEVQQVIGKLMGTGGSTKHWNVLDLRTKLIEEIGDVVAACLFVAKANGFEEEVIAQMEYKYDRFMKWHAEQQTTGEQT